MVEVRCKDVMEQQEQYRPASMLVLDWRFMVGNNIHCVSLVCPRFVAAFL